MTPVPVCLTIAGSDSGGGAGIQADLKAFAACGVHGTSAITAITAQNTVGVTAVHPVPPEIIEAQVRAILDDLPPRAIKLGMLGDAPTVEAVARALDEADPKTPLVVDPVMVAESGAVLLAPDARDALVELILPRATVATPNVPEARVLADDGRETLEPHDLVRAVRDLGPAGVVLTGGHRDTATDLFDDGTTITEIPGPRHPDGAAHGSGCTHASALAAFLAHGATPLEAARDARRIAARAVERGLREIGAGPGPVDVLGTRATAPADRAPAPSLGGARLA
jgi:hydroxymethylpyrimidine/phosphomethylpyrimidine kinase